MGVHLYQLMNELEVKIEKDAEVRRDTLMIVEEVLAFWKSIAPSPGDPDHPYAEGTYKSSIQRFSEEGRHPAGTVSASGKKIGGQFMYHHWVGTFDPVASLLEYGTLPDTKSDKAKWIDLDGEWHHGPNTPTAAYAYAARTAAHWGGTAP